MIFTVVIPKPYLSVIAVFWRNAMKRWFTPTKAVKVFPNLLPWINNVAINKITMM